MTAKYLNDIYNAGYTAQAPFDEFTLSGLGYIGGNGFFSLTTAPTTLDNRGDIEGHGANAGVYLAQNGSIVNSGAIGAVSSNAIYLYDGGTVTNLGSAEITGATNGVYAFNGGTVTNAGTTKGASGAGISIYSYGSVANQTGGVIQGITAGVIFKQNFGTVTNAGTIKATATTATAAGVVMHDGAIITNSLYALIQGYTGISIGGGGSISNAGTINGLGGGPSNAAAGVTLTGANNVISNRAGGLIEGLAYGIGAVGAATITNGGTISGNDVGVSLAAGGTLTNGAYGLISGRYGVSVGGAATIVNAGSIGGGDYGVLLADGGSLSNSGTISGANGYGLKITNGGTVTNLAAGLIQSRHIGLFSEAVAPTITNIGVIGGSSGAGILFNSGGNLINGTGGTVQGAVGVIVGAQVGTVVNAGAINGVYLAAGGRVGNSGTITASGNDIAVLLKVGGSVVNGAGGVMTAGTSGIETKAGGTVVNAGTISATNGNGVFLHDSGRVGNTAGGVISGTQEGIFLYTGGTATNAAGGRVQGGSDGIYAFAGTASVGNSGTVTTVNYYGIHLGAGGSVSNNIGGTVKGHNAGVFIDVATGTVVNSGSIFGTAGAGVKFNSGGDVTNKIGGLIQGTTGVYLAGGGTVTNFGTIAGTGGGIAVNLATAGEVLIDEAGSVFKGNVVGTGGTLKLAGTVGAMTGLGSRFTGFAEVDLLAGASWVFTGSNTATGNFNDLGTLVDNGSLTLQGGGAIGVATGTGTLTFAGGVTTLAKSSALGAARAVVSGGNLALGINLTGAGSFTQSGGVVTLAGHLLNLTGTDSFTGGQVLGGGTLGTLATRGRVGLSQLTLDDSAVWNVFGRVTDTGSLTLGGASVLVDEAGGTFDISGDHSILRAAGATGTIANHGLLEKTSGTGASKIAPPISNSGTIAVTAGTLELQGAVTGIGSAKIGSAGTLKLDASVVATQTVAFAGTSGGTLLLNDPAGNGLSFLGKVAGFGGSDRLDFAGFTFVAGSTPSWSQNGSTGKLTVTEGTHSAAITLVGQFTSSGFHAASDTHGGTVITYTG